MKQKHKKDFIYLIAILLLFVLLRLPTLYEPFGRDQGIFATVASGLLEGKMPYRDLWDHKPPGIYFLYALVFKLLGKEMRSVALFDGLSTMFTILLLFKLSRELFDRRSAYLATIIFTVLSSGIFFFGWWGRGQPEVFMLLPILGVISLLKPVAGKAKSGFSFLFAGLLGGIAFSLKTTILPLLFLSSLFLLIEDGMSTRGMERGIAKILLFSSGVIIALLPFLIFFGMNTAWDEFFYSNVTFNLSAHTHHPYDLDFLIKLKDHFDVIGTRIHFLWWTIFLLALYGLIRITRIEKKKRALLIVWMAGTILSICMGWWLFYYHFIILIPPLAVFTSCGFFQLSDRLIFQRTKRYQIAGNLIVSLLALFLLLEFLLAYYSAYISTGIMPALLGRGKINAVEIYSRYRVQEITINDFSFTDDYLLAQYLKTHTRKEEKIFIWGWEALVYFLSEREPASRYIFIYPLIQDNLEKRRDAQKIFWKELNKNKPRYFMVAKNDQNPIDQIGSEKRLSLFPELGELLKRNYAKENETERFIIYRRMP